MMSTEKKYGLLKNHGVACKTDFGLSCHRDVNNALLVASIYGAAQQVKALFSLFSMGHQLNYVFPDSDRSISFSRDRSSTLRFKGTSVGYGKQHGLIWSDYVYSQTEIIYWFSPEEKEVAICSALSKRRIPYIKKQLPWIEKILVDYHYFEPLRGWGGIQGYLCEFGTTADDHICSLICEEIRKKK